LPGTRTKNEEATVVPLSTIALKVLQSVPWLNDTFVFPARGNEKSHFSGYASGKKALDYKVKLAGVALENWTLHDLRRTLATNLGKREVPPHVIEHILNHKATSMTGVAKIYNRYAYGKEKREALQLWADHVGELAKRDVKPEAPTA
jgi:integrase